MEDEISSVYDFKSKYPVEWMKESNPIQNLSDKFLHTFDVIFVSLNEANLDFLNQLQKRRPELLIVAHCDATLHHELDKKIIYVSKSIPTERLKQMVSEINRRMREVNEHDELLGTSKLIKIMAEDFYDLDDLIIRIKSYLEEYIPFEVMKVIGLYQRKDEKAQLIYSSKRKVDSELSKLLDKSRDDLFNHVDHKSPYLSFYEGKSKVVVTFNLGVYDSQPLYVQLITDSRERDNCFQLINELFYKVVSSSLSLLDTTEFKNLFKDLAYQDDVTGLYNQRKLFQDLELLINEKNIFSVLFIDIDDFKNVNDDYGHIAGSDILGRLAVLFKESIRQTDYFYRYGGDEFIIILANTNAEDAKVVAQRLLVSIKAQAFEVSKKKKYNMSASIGIAEYPKDAQNAKEIISIADNMMYNSKKSGKGSVVINIT